MGPIEFPLPNSSRSNVTVIADGLQVKLKQLEFSFGSQTPFTNCQHFAEGHGPMGSTVAPDRIRGWLKCALYPTWIRRPVVDSEN